MALSAGFVMPEFYGSKQDHEKFIDDFIAYINLAGANIAAIRDANAKAIMGIATSFPNVSAGYAGKYEDHLVYTPAQKKTQFMLGIREDISDKVFRIGQHRPINDIFDSLTNIELCQGVLGLPSSSYLSHSTASIIFTSQQQEIFLTDIQKIFQDILAQQKTENQRNFARFDRIEEELDETYDAIVQFNYSQSYFTPLKFINLQYTPPNSDEKNEGYNEDNSKYIIDSLGWYIDVPVTLKDKEDKTVTVIENFVYINNGKTELMLFLSMSNIQKL
ncbi:hypothetical protein C1645_821171 [Glomus cerebriforme]|uniref:Uncharacterized protein n=1 Tax=Glomus cerebriforme TaxID=658196 RepID=A0A397T2Q2_9GLOM|nr:hypothetical protein C1645_821171 [Glomus cerebriforme]